MLHAAHKVGEAYTSYCKHTRGSSTHDNKLDQAAAISLGWLTMRTGSAGHETKRWMLARSVWFRDLCLYRCGRPQGKRIPTWYGLAFYLRGMNWFCWRCIWWRHLPLICGEYILVKPVDRRWQRHLCILHHSLGAGSGSLFGCF